MMADAIEERLEQLEAAIKEEPKVIKGGSENKRNRRTLKKYYRKIITDFIPRKKKYETANDTFNGRNSYSKTDTDATFMNLKEDLMRHRELKPAYNLQIATNQQFVIAYDIFPNPTDTRTLKPFLQSIPTLDYFTSIVADAGYGSQDNYHFVIEELENEALIPYAIYRKEQTKRYRQDSTQRANWHYDEMLDVYVDHQGVQFSFSHYSQRRDQYGQIKDFKVYKADLVQENEALDRLALTPKGYQRRIQVNLVWESFKAQVKQNLESDSGRQRYAQRKIDVESVFGRMKRNFGVRRTHVRGETAVRNDIGLLLMGMNLTKLAEILRRNGGLFYQAVSFHLNKRKRGKISKPNEIFPLYFGTFCLAPSF